MPMEYFGTITILHLVEELKISLEMVESQQERESLRNQIPNATASYVMEWLVNHTAVNNETYQERLTRLEGDKESLILQVSVLTDQVEAQGDKIRDLESCVEVHQVKLNATEEMLQQELLSRTSLETQKLDLMAEVSNLKIKLVGLEKEKTDYEESYNKAESVVNMINELQEQMCKMQLEINNKIQEREETQTSKSDLTEPPNVHMNELIELPQPMKCPGYQEVQRLKLGMETLLAANEEKDMRIEELTLLLNQYRRVKNFVMATHGSSERILSASSEDEVESTIKKLMPKNNQTTEGSSTLSSPNAPSSPPQNILENGISTPGPSEICSSPQEDHSEHRTRTHPRKLSTSLEDLQSGTVEKHDEGESPEPVVTPVVTPENKGDPRYQTLPGKLSHSTPNGSHDSYRKPASQNALHINSETNGIQSLCETENNLDITFNDLSGTDSSPHSQLSPDGKKSPKGIKKFWGKLRRTPSGHFNADELGLSEFKRGGMRATAGPRLARSKDPRTKNSDYNAPFAQWSNEQVCNWLEDFGLGQYVIFARQWVNSGHTLLTATPQILEKELGIKHPLHRKKLQLAISSINTKKEDKSGQLDHVWVTRWLDDIGLPQYKDQFHEARVDGRMLQYLTVNDLLFLKVTSQLHHLSIKCAIHVLHANKFNPNCLRRRPADENNISPSEVVQWSNHRVMEWLRYVDLAEYAPNLRGSGVHGGLVILEPRFNSDTLAMLLNIPPQKTLLRRHLATNFSLLIGPEAQQEKREIMDSPTYSPLSTTAKVRPKKLGLSHFGHLRKKKFDDSTDYVCPVDASSSKSEVKAPNNSPVKEADKLEQVGRLI
uniref:SAM domain-containing protein n=1 Tax=Pyxicephalus adspersus TaxID=30357 RepID=A0AAV2ZXQ5_PYXAD|nr:TPA: hypothetical protein GDO54_002885 [Pyxicephalus adspersus]